MKGDTRPAERCSAAGPGWKPPCRWLLFLFFCPEKADPHSRHPPSLGHGYSDEQRHAHAGARRGVRLRVSGREGLHQFLLLFRGLPLRSVAAWAVAHPHCKDRLVRTHLLPHRICSLQPRLLGLLSVSLGPLSICIHTFSIRFGGDVSKGGGGPSEIFHICFLSFPILNICIFERFIHKLALQML